MVKVYFETPNGSYGELVAIFDSEELYDRLYPILEDIATKNRMVVTESVNEEIDINEIKIEQ